MQFHVSYADPNRGHKSYEHIATDSSAPYGTVWECLHVPDQAWLDFYFQCIQVNHDGTRDTSLRRYAVLDRNLRTSGLTMVSTFARHEVIVDGVRGDGEPWPDTAGIVIRNDDNRYAVHSCWDDSCLYLLAEVDDSLVYTRFAAPDSAADAWDSIVLADVASLANVWLDDCVAFLLDINHSGSELPEPDDRLIYVSPSGRFQARAHAARWRVIRNWGKAVRTAATVYADSGVEGRRGYVVEAALPWRSLGTRPAEGLVLGLEVYVVDRERPDRERIVTAWSSDPHVHRNASEWGDLVLGGSSSGFPFAAGLGVFAAVALAAGIAFVYGRRRALAKGTAAVPIPAAAHDASPQAALVQRAREYIDLHWSETQLSRDTVAAQLRVSANYLSKHFRTHAGASFSDYVNRIRVARAQELLATTDKSVTAIALACGYGTLDHFIRVFKRHTGYTPLRFRQQSKGSEL